MPPHCWLFVKILNPPHLSSPLPQTSLFFPIADCVDRKLIIVAPSFDNLRNFAFSLVSVSTPQCFSQTLSFGFTSRRLSIACKRYAFFVQDFLHRKKQLLNVERTNAQTDTATSDISSSMMIYLYTSCIQATLVWPLHRIADQPAFVLIINRQKNNHEETVGGGYF